MEKLLLEKYCPKAVIGPVNLNTGANTGNRVDMKNAKRVTFIVNLGAGTTTSAHVFNLLQANAASAGTSKALSVANPYYHKIGAATKFTKVDPAGVSASAYDLHALLADSASIVAFEVLAEDLDVNGGFEWVEMDVPVTGGAQVGSVIAIVHSDFAPAYAQVV